MPSKKEPLSIITIKTLLAVIIFAGIGTIIVGGGWLIGKHNKVSEPIKKDVVVDNNKTEDETAIREKTPDETANWKTYRDEKYGFEMKYPEGFFTKQVLQPKTEATQCDYANFINNCPAKITINGVPFCSRKTGEGAAGTTYETYNYTTVRDTKCFVVSFTVTYPNCSNLLPAANQEIQEAYDRCMLDNEVTKPKTINQILSTFKFTGK